MALQLPMLHSIELDSLHSSTQMDVQNSNLEHVWIIKVTGLCKAGGDEGAGAQDGLHWWR